MHRYPLLALLSTIIACAAIRAEDTPAPADAPADHQGSRKVVAASDDGSITLHANDASVHGSTIRYEPKPEKNTIGYWTKADDWASWEFDAPKAGSYKVEVLQGCGKGSGGAEVEVSVGDQSIRFTVDDTGGFQNFVARKIGALKIAAGRQTISVKAKTKPGLAVMDLRQIVL
ncbi:MAG TPA: sulfatase, partial [Chthoniobacteraceae bacterium]